MRHFKLSVLCWMCCSVAVAAPDNGRLNELLWLQGQWHGQRSGAAGAAELRRDIVCALQCRYLNVEAQQRELSNNPHGELSTALAMWTFHPGRGRLLLHTIDDRVSVTTYTEDLRASTPQSLVLVYENQRDGSRTRLTYRFNPPDAYAERVEHAARGKDWDTVAESHFARERDDRTIWSATGQEKAPSFQKTHD